MNSIFSIEDFILQPPEEFALLELPSGELKIFLGPFSAHQKPQLGQTNIYLNDFFLTSDTPYLVCTNHFSLTVSERRKAIEVATTVPKLYWSKHPQSEFIESFIFFRELLEEKTLSKAVPISFTHAELSKATLEKTELAWLLRKLIIGQSGLYSYALRTNDFILVGASPEILFSVDQAKSLIKSEAVAGSIISANAPLSQITGKLKEEHELVVQDLEKQLSVFGNVQKGEISLKSLSSLCHLRTPLEVYSKGKIDISKLISILHPSGALGILPRAELSHPFLKALDLSNTRKYFGAPFGAIFEDGSATILVAIRNLMITGSKVQLGAGAGITTQSEQNSELEEVLAKQESVKVFFGLA